MTYFLVRRSTFIIGTLKSKTVKPPLFIGTGSYNNEDIILLLISTNPQHHTYTPVDRSLIQSICSGATKPKPTITHLMHSFPLKQNSKKKSDAVVSAKVPNTKKSIKQMAEVASEGSTIPVEITRMTISCAIDDKGHKDSTCLRPSATEFTPSAFRV